MDVVIPVDGSQPEVENMQENMQEVLTQEDMRGNDEGNAGRMEIRAEDPQAKAQDPETTPANDDIKSYDNSRYKNIIAELKESLVKN
jgi:hypothetical protein